VTDEELRKLDAEVHRVVFAETGCACGPADNGYDPDTGFCLRCGNRTVPQYSARMADASLVIDEMAKRCEGFELIDWPEDGEKRWLAYFGNNLRRPGECKGEVEEATAPVAICKAALAASASSPPLMPTLVSATGPRRPTLNHRSPPTRATGKSETPTNPCGT
jgi:hypothetical protein